MEAKAQVYPQKMIIVEQGKENKMHTMWIEFIDGSQYVKPRFIKNLSTDAETAMQKAHEYAQKIGVDSSFVIDNTRNLNAIKKIYKWTDSMVRFGKNYGVELKDCEPKFIVWIAKGSPLIDQHSGEWCNHYFGGENFCVLAQRLAVEMNLGKIENRIGLRQGFISCEQYDKNTEFLAQKSVEIEDHFFTSGQRLDLTLTCTKRTGYESSFGFVNIYKFIDSENRVFTYKGSKGLGIDKDDTCTLTASIKHDEFRGVKSTYLQRIKNIN
jgi:hypothetical protein